MAKTNRKLDDIYGVKSDRPSLLKMPEGTTSDWVRNRHYHNYFRGYTEVKTTNEYGRVITKRIYTSPWTVSSLSNRNYWLVRVLFSLLVIGSIALYIFSMSRDIPGNRHWVIAIPGLPVIVFMILLIVRIGIFIAAPRKMTLWDYESTSTKLRRIALLAAAFELLTGLALIIFGLVTKEFLSETLLCGFLDIGAAVLTAAIWFIEKRLPYEEVANHAVLPEGEAYQIR